MGRDLEFATRNLNLLKQGVNVEEVEKMRKHKEKSDAEGYLQRTCKRIEASQTLKNLMKKNGVDQRFKVVNRE